MKHFLIKFNHGVEIGAMLAYVGHFFRTFDDRVWEIAMEEVEHRANLKNVLSDLGEKPSPIIDGSFRLIGNLIRFLCKISPIWSLDFIARMMELFAVFNYSRLAKAYPQYQSLFERMASAEQVHGDYFRRKK